MTSMHEDHHAPPAFWRSRYALGLLVMGAVAVFFLSTEHRAHLLGVLPYLLLLACPLMHVMMHRGHHRPGHSPAQEPGARPVPPAGRPPGESP